MSRKRLSQLNLIWAFLGFMALGAMVFFGVTLFFTSQRVSQMQDDVLRNVVEVRGNHIVMDLVDVLEGHWTDLESLAGALPFSDMASFRSLLTREVMGGTHMAWTGYVDVHGNVIASSYMQREGENLATEEWFQAAQRGPSIAFTFDPNGSKRLVMTVPVKTSGLATAGYLSFHFQPDWLDNTFTQILRSVLLDVVIFDDQNRRALTSFDFDEQNANLASVRNALAGHKTVALEEWKGLGPRYAVSIPIEPHGSMPALSWRILALASSDQFGAETEMLRTSLFEILAGVAAALLVMSMGFIRIFLVPLHRLVENAEAMASGQDIVPYEDHRTAELSLLSSSLSRLQGRILLAEDRTERLQEELDHLKSNGTNISLR